MLNNYVLGFAFDVRTGAVALIKKTHPEWQAGKWNGIGGRIEGNESPLDAMVREFEEEAGVKTDPAQWRKAGTMSSTPAEYDKRGWVCHVFTMRERLEGRVQTMTDEEVRMHNPAVAPLFEAFGEGIENVVALIELCRMHKDHTGVIPHFKLVYP